MIVGKMKRPCKDCPFTKNSPIEEFAEALAESEFACHELLGEDDELDCAGRLELIERIEVGNYEKRSLSQ